MKKMPTFETDLWQVAAILCLKFSQAKQFKNYSFNQRMRSKLIQLKRTATQVKSELQIEIRIFNSVHIWGLKLDWGNSFENNQKMLKTHEQLVGKVRIVGLLVDDFTESVLEKVTSKKWKQIEHYRFLNIFQNDCFQKIQYSIPYVFLINKLGKIDYLGNPSNFNIEARKNELIIAEDDVNLCFRRIISRQSLSAMPTYGCQLIFGQYFNIQEQSVEFDKNIKNEVQQYYSPFKKEHLIFINGTLTDLSVLDKIDEQMIGKKFQTK